MNAIKNTLKKIFAHWGIKIQRIPKRSSKLIEILGLNEIPIKEIVINNNGTITLRSLNNLEINPKQHKFIIEGYRILFELKECYNAKLDVSSILTIEIGDLKFKISTYEEIFILKEIFITGVYNLSIAPNKKAIFIDIGMNIAITSLFFASKPQITAVFSFEPFYETFIRAEENININSNFRKKIRAYNYGLGNSDRKEIWEYDPEYKGSMGINGLPDFLSNKPSEHRKVEVKIKDIVPELKEIINENISCQKIGRASCRERV